MTTANLLHLLRSPLGSSLRTTAIALEIDGAVASAVQLAYTPAGDIRLHASAQLTLPDNLPPEDRIAALSRTLERRAFVGNRISLCAAVTQTDSDLLQLAELRSSDESASVDDLAARTLARGDRAASGGGGCDESEIAVTCWQHGTDSAASIFAVGLRHEIARQLVAPFDHAGKEVFRIGCAAQAVAEILHRFGHAHDCSAVLRLGFDSHVLLLCQGRDVIYQRTLDAAGWNSITARDQDFAHPVLSPGIRAHLTLVAEETAHTLRCVPRTFPGLDVKRLLLLGPRSDSASLLDYCRQTLPGLRPLDLSDISTPDDTGRLLTGMDIALGLALEEVPV